MADKQAEESNIQVIEKQMSRVPPRQNPYEQALVLGFDTLLSKDLSAEKLKALGAETVSGIIRLPVLDRFFLIDPANREVCIENGGRVKCMWALLAVHYLCADELAPDTREVSFNHFADSRGYYTVFSKRILGRFLATVGRTREKFKQASESLHAERIPGTGVCYRFNILPRVPLTIIRHDEDDEFGPSANIIYQADAEFLLPAEDRIVAVELLLDLLSSKPIEEGI